MIVVDANGGWRLQDALVAAQLLEPLPSVYDGVARDPLAWTSGRYVQDNNSVDRIWCLSRPADGGIIVRLRYRQSGTRCIGQKVRTRDRRTESRERKLSALGPIEDVYIDFAWADGTTTPCQTLQRTGTRAVDRLSISV